MTIFNGVNFMYFIFVFIFSFFINIFSSELDGPIKFEANELPVCIACQDKDKLSSDKKYILAIHDSCDFESGSTADDQRKTKDKYSRLEELNVNESLAMSAKYGTFNSVHHLFSGRSTPDVFTKKYTKVPIADPNGLFLDRSLNIHGFGSALSTVAALHRVLHDKPDIFELRGQDRQERLFSEKIQKDNKLRLILSFMDEYNLHENYNGGHGAYFSVTPSVAKSCISLYAVNRIKDMRDYLFSSDESEIKDGGKISYASNSFEEWKPGRTPIFYAETKYIKALAERGYNVRSSGRESAVEYLENKLKDTALSTIEIVDLESRIAFLKSCESSSPLVDHISKEIKEKVTLTSSCVESSTTPSEHIEKGSTNTETNQWITVVGKKRNSSWRGRNFRGANKSKKK